MCEVKLRFNGFKLEEISFQLTDHLMEEAA